MPRALPKTIAVTRGGAVITELPARTLEFCEADHADVAPIPGLIGGNRVVTRWLVPQHQVTRDFLTRFLPGPFSFYTSHPEQPGTVSVFDVVGLRFPLPEERRRYRLRDWAMMVEELTGYAIPAEKAPRDPRG